MKKTFLFCLTLLGSLSTFANSLEAPQAPACEGLYIYINCTGEEACAEVARQEKVFAPPLAAAGLKVYSIQNFWKKVWREKEDADYFVDFNPRTAKIRAKAPTITFEGERAAACVENLVQLLATTTPTPIIINNTPNNSSDTWYSSKRADSPAIIYNWSNPNQY
ncbi:hypothetical protein D3C87_1268470 [compost metagenome]